MDITTNSLTGFSLPLIIKLTAIQLFGFSITLLVFLMPKDPSKHLWLIPLVPGMLLQLGCLIYTGFIHYKVRKAKTNDTQQMKLANVAGGFSLLIVGIQVVTFGSWNTVDTVLVACGYINILSGVLGVMWNSK